MKVEYRAPLNQAELDDSIQCSVRAFGGLEHLFTNIVKHDPWFHLNNTRACFLDGQIVSVVQIFDRPMRIGNCVVRMGGIGSVGTVPEHRRAGYSLNVLRDSVQYMQTAGYVLSILFTGIQSHYARAGWAMYPTYSMRLTLPESLGEVPDGAIIQQYQPEQDLPALMEIYDQFNANQTGTIARTEEYWNNQPKWRGYEPALFWVARRDGAIVAYLKASQWDIGEFGYLPDAVGAMMGLFRHFFQKAKAEGANEIGGPGLSTGRKMFEALGCTVRRRESNHTMIRIINLESLLRKIAPLLEARLKASDFSGWDGWVRIRYEAAERVLRINGGKITISQRNESPDIDLPVSQEQLLKLLFGNMTAEQVAFSNGLPLNDGEVSLMDALFPPGELFLWGTDGF